MTPTLLLISWLATTAGLTTSTTTTTTVTHFRQPPAAQWKLELRTDPGTPPSARVWWIVGPAVHRGMPERLIRRSGLEQSELPDEIRARIAEIDAVGCPALTRIARDLQALTTGEASISLAGLAPEDPRVRWAERSWPQLEACATAAADAVVPSEREPDDRGRAVDTVRPAPGDR